MRRLMLAAAAALALAACNQQGSGPALPQLQEGAIAPATLTPQPGAQQAQIDDETRTALIANITEMLVAMQGQSGLSQAEGIADQIAPMQPGTDNRAVITLNAGTGYTIVGACDGDCTNMDIELISMETGGVVASDMLPDDFPVVTFAPPANGQYMVRMLMQACSIAPCYGGARVLSAGGAAAPTAPQPEAGGGEGGAKP
ncbi:MAG: hypothetical protein K2X34_13040 [Hyphomonadaceae bacterium]|nr:hypothetical protein [Hyphomonadaceae bacterium]